MNQELRLTIPMEPPSGNHYKSCRVIGKHVSFYLTKAAKDWYATVAEFAWFLPLEPLEAMPKAKEHAVEYTVFQGSGSRGDVDNFSKTILDGLVKAGVLRSDATVTEMIARKRRDRDNPRTEIIVRAIR